MLKDSHFQVIIIVFFSWLKKSKTIYNFLESQCLFFSSSATFLSIYMYPL